MVAIFVKESLGEYGSGWGWDGDNNVYAHVFDQGNTGGIPYRFMNDGVAFDSSTSVCYGQIELTGGQILSSSSVYRHQVSCSPHTYNLGNYYSWPTSTAGGNNAEQDIVMKNSVCAKGWTLPTGTDYSDRDFRELIVDTYNITTSQVGLTFGNPFDLSKAGEYYRPGEDFVKRGSYSLYWTARLGTHSRFEKETYKLNSEEQGYYRAFVGLSLRCVGGTQKESLGAHGSGWANRLYMGSQPLRHVCIIQPHLQVILVGNLTSPHTRNYCA